MKNGKDVRNKGKAEEIIDMERMECVNTYVAPLDEKFRSRGVIRGIYNVYMRPLVGTENQCSDPDCDDILVEISSRAIAVMDNEGCLIKVTALAPEKLVSDLIATNKKVIACLTHQAVMELRGSEMNPVQPAIVHQLSQYLAKNDNSRRKD